MSIILVAYVHAYDEDHIFGCIHPDVILSDSFYSCPFYSARFVCQYSGKLIYFYQQLEILNWFQKDPTFENNLCLIQCRDKQDHAPRTVM